MLMQQLSTSLHSCLYARGKYTFTSLEIAPGFVRSNFLVVLGHTWGVLLHTLSKLYDVPVGFVSPIF